MKEKSERIKSKSMSSGAPLKALSNNQKKLLCSRIKFCYAYIQAKNGYCDGYRHLLLFVFSTAAVPLYGPAVAKNKLRSLSMLFIGGDKISEKYISSTVDRMMRIKYKLTNQKIAGLFGITLDEYKMLALSNTYVEKRKNQKIETRKKREIRKAIIIEAIENGKTHREAARIAGCSCRTVDYVVAAIREGENESVSETFVYK